MTTRLKGRRRAAERILADLQGWASANDSVRGLAVVGSYARGTERMASDVDVMLLTEQPDELAESDWFEDVHPGARLVRVEHWGPVRERRYRLRSGLLVELDIAPLSWADVPVDPGTRRVLQDGHQILYDDAEVLMKASTAIRPGK